MESAMVRRVQRLRTASTDEICCSDRSTCGRALLQHRTAGSPAYVAQHAATLFVRQCHNEGLRLPRQTARAIRALPLSYDNYRTCTGAGRGDSLLTAAHAIDQAPCRRGAGRHAALLVALRGV